MPNGIIKNPVIISPPQPLASHSFRQCYHPQFFIPRPGILYKPFSRQLFGLDWAGHSQLDATTYIGSYVGFASLCSGQAFRGFASPTRRLIRILFMKKLTHHYEQQQPRGEPFCWLQHGTAEPAQSCIVRLSSESNGNEYPSRSIPATESSPSAGNGKSQKRPPSVITAIATTTAAATIRPTSIPGIYQRHFAKHHAAYL